MDNLTFAMWASAKSAEGATVIPRPTQRLMTVQIALELVSSLPWNHCPVSRGIGVQFGLEYALVGTEGFAGAAREALTKLGVPWEPSSWERAYNEGRSTQVPVNAVVRVKGRFSRQLSYRGKPLVLER